MYCICIFLLLSAAFMLAAPVVTDQFGLVKLNFAPGDTVYVYFSEPGTAHIKVIDAATGAVVLEKTINVKSPGPQLLWYLPPNTAEGVYRVYITFNEQPYVYSIQIAAPTLWQLYLVYLVPATAVAAAAYTLLRYRVRLAARPRALPSYRLQLPNNYVVEINRPYAVFGREFFLKLGVPREIARYISRNHFAIYAERRRFYIQDVGSKNGTWLNGRPIKGLNPQPLKHGDVITVAQVLSLRFLSAK
ncbi:MAG: FHA domain-containing protein [Thermoproteaceae archaeon]|jgi:hypothetical protein|nr:FHA domain-containing protein [Thermoproteaceae archaeon]